MPSAPAAKPLRIALFVGEMKSAQDGSVKTVRKILDHLEREKIPFLVLCPTAPEQWPYQHGQLYPLDALPSFFNSDYHVAAPWQKSFLKRLDAFQPTVIHLSTACPTGHLGRKYALSRRLPLMGIYHTHFIGYFRYYHASLFIPLGYRLMRRFYNSFNLLLVPTQTMMNELSRVGIRTPMRLWSRGIDTNLFNPSQPSEAW